jgi:hypothetical protein
VLRESAAALHFPHSALSCTSVCYWYNCCYWWYQWYCTNYWYHYWRCCCYWHCCCCCCCYWHCCHYCLCCCCCQGLHSCCCLCSHCSFVHTSGVYRPSCVLLSPPHGGLHRSHAATFHQSHLDSAYYHTYMAEITCTNHSQENSLHWGQHNKEKPAFINHHTHR